MNKDTFSVIIIVTVVLVYLMGVYLGYNQGKINTTKTLCERETSKINTISHEQYLVLYNKCVNGNYYKEK